MKSTTKLYSRYNFNHPDMSGFRSIKITDHGHPDGNPAIINTQHQDTGTYPHLSQMFYGSTSGTMPHSSLSPSYQSSVSQNEGLSMYKPQLVPPASPCGTPAYCFHCLQFGSVFTINPDGLEISSFVYSFSLQFYYNKVRASIKCTLRFYYCRTYKFPPIF